MRQVVGDAASLAERIRAKTGLDTVTVRSAAFVLLSSAERSFGVQVFGVDTAHEALVSTIPGLVRQGSYLRSNDAQERSWLAVSLRAI